MDTEQQLAWEARQRPRAAVAAIAAGVLTLLSGGYAATTSQDVPQASFLESIGRLGDGPIGGLPSLRIPVYEYYSDHAGAFIGQAIASGLGSLLVGVALTFLAFAVRARRPEFPRLGTYLGFIGGVLFGVGVIAIAIGTASTINDILDGPRTVSGVADAEAAPALTAGQILEFAGRFALGLGYLLIALNAMRAGLLTRFMGILGIIVGALLVIRLPVGPIVLESFWLIALGLTFLGRAPGGVPPAWRTGQAEPWPSAAESRMARDTPDPVAATAGPSPNTAAKKRKRKRRG